LIRESGGFDCYYVVIEFVCGSLGAHTHIRTA